MKVKELINLLNQIENKEATIGKLEYDDEGDEWGVEIDSIIQQDYVKYGCKFDYYL